MNSQSVTEFLQLGRKASDEQRAKGNIEMAVRIIQITSLIALRNPRPLSRPVICHCGRQLRTGVEIEFFNNVGECHQCDHVRSDN